VIVLWAVLLITFMVLRPRPGSLAFWLLIVPAFVAGGFYMLQSYSEKQQSQRQWSAWEARLRVLVDVNDVDDDGHLYEWFEPAEWEKIFSELENMPKGSRRLSQAIGSVDSDFFREDA
jgi:hypothetical protein